MQQLTFDPEPTQKPGKLIFSLTIPGKLPSLNELLGMEHWRRYQFKKELADVFMFALRQYESDCSTKIIRSPSTTLTFSATLACYLEMIRQRRISRSASRKQSLGREKKFASKFTKSEVPF